MFTTGIMDGFSIIFWLSLCVGLACASLNTSHPQMQNSKASKKSRRLIPDEQRLLEKIFRNYDNSVRPVYNATDSVQVSFGLTLIQVLDMDEKNQVLVTNVWLEHVWIDERILWDPAKYNNLKVLRIPAHKLWLPDIVLYNNADDYTEGYMKTNAMVSHNGEIFWSPPARLRSSCKVDITYFPFDLQECALKFGSWTYDQAQVDIVNKSDDIDMSNYISNGEWHLVSNRVVRNEVVYPISDAVYPDVTIYFAINRLILYYVLNIILPCVWLNLLSLLAFCLPPDAGEKITLGITVLLSYSVFMLLVAENMPPTSEFIPLIGIYLTISMAVTSISVILTVCVLKLHHCGPHQRRVPNWLRFLVLRCIASCVHGRCFSSDKKAKTKPKQRHTGALANEDVCLRLVSEINNSKYSPVAEFKRNHKVSSTNHAPPRGLHNLEDEKMHNCSPPSGFTNGHYYANQPYSNQSSQMSPEIASQDMRRVKIMEEILRYLKIMVAKRDEDDAENDITNEWRQVAQVTDRFLFWLFLFFTVNATVFMIILIPLMRYL